MDRGRFKWHWMACPDHLPIQLQCLMTCLSSVPAGFIIGAMWINNGFSLTLIGFNYKKTPWYEGKISIYSLTCSWIIYRHTIKKINSNRSLTCAKNFNWPFRQNFLISSNIWALFFIIFLNRSKYLSLN